MSGKASSGAASSAADKKAITSAMTAAPKKVAAAATIVAVGTDGKMRTLRKGNNGFTCMPDNPTTPGPDPMCMDQAALEWAEAWMGHKPPTVGKVGFMYMLAGGTDASNVDPYAMIVGAEARFYDMYPKHKQPDTALPYVMWSGTPYQHLMIPVK